MAWQRTGPTEGWWALLRCALFWHRFDPYKRVGPWIKMRNGWAHKVRCERCGIKLLLWPAVMEPEDE
jgi:hypothetical protein